MEIKTCLNVFLKIMFFLCVTLFSCVMFEN